MDSHTDHGSHGDKPKRVPPEVLEAWRNHAAEELGIDPAQAPIDLILKVAADVAHGVARPAAPLSTFLLGLAVGSLSRGDASLGDLANELAELASRWETPDDKLSSPERF